MIDGRRPALRRARAAGGRGGIASIGTAVVFDPLLKR
jgi:hypothetical protein